MADEVKLTVERIEEYRGENRLVQAPYHPLEQWMVEENVVLDAICDAAKRGLRDREDAKRYRWIQEHGIPCLHGDECGSYSGEELDTEINAVRIAAQKEGKA